MEQNCFLLDHAYYAGRFIYNRSYNWYEILEGNLPYATALTLLGSIPYKFGNNPTAKVFIRDFTMLFSIMIVAWRKVEIGSTGIKYDWGVVLGQALMSAGKIATIVTYVYYSPSWGTLGGIGIFANFVWRPALRLFKIASRQYPQYLNSLNQNYKCPLQYTNFIKYNFLHLLTEGIKESLPKIFLSNLIIGEAFKNCFKYIYSYADLASNFLITQTCFRITSAHVTNFDGQRGIYNKAALCFAASNNNLSIKMLAYLAFILSESIVLTIRETLISYFFVPLSNSAAESKIIMDWLFGSISKTSSTALGMAGTILCCANNYHKPICAIAGISFKVATDTLINAIEERSEELSWDTTKTDLAGETHELAFQE